MRDRVVEHSGLCSASNSSGILLNFFIKFMMYNVCHFANCNLVECM